MIGKKIKARNALERLADALVEDILCASDHDLLDEVREDGGDVERFAAEMRAQFERSVIIANKSKLKAAKAGLVRTAAFPMEPVPPIDIREARAILRRLMAQPGGSALLTMAARKESELSDADVVGVLMDLRALGVSVPDDNEDGTP